jgi:hypothetical protein
MSLVPSVKSLSDGESLSINFIIIEEDIIEAGKEGHPVYAHHWEEEKSRLPRRETAKKGEGYI